MTKLKKYYFTFGYNQTNRCQIIFATNYSNARDCMIEHYGIMWAFQYTEDQWKRITNDKNRSWDMPTPFERVLHGK